MIEDVYDNVCTFILKYKQHIEPAQRTTEIQCVEKCKNLMFEQNKEIFELKTKIEELETKNKELITTHNNTKKQITEEVEQLKSVFQQLTKSVCMCMDSKNYKELDAVLYNVTEIFNKLEDIPEF